MRRRMHPSLEYNYQHTRNDIIDTYDVVDIDSRTVVCERAIALAKERILIASNASPSLSTKPKSGTMKVCEPSSTMAMVISVPTGASLTELTVIAKVSLCVNSPPNPPLSKIARQDYEQRCAMKLWRR